MVRFEEFFEKSLSVLRHTIRRKVLEFLWEKEHPFVELSTICVADHGKLGYHLRRMKNIVEHDPDRKVYRLTDEGRLIHGWFIQARSDFTKRSLDLKVTKQFNPIRYVETLRLGDHATLFYEDENVKRAVSLPFLRTGLLRDLAVIYLASERRMDREAKELRESDVYIEELEEKGAFTIMSGEEWYLRRGRASADVIIGNWLDLAKEKMKEGYRGIQAATEMDAFFDNAKISELLVYERKLGQKIPPTVCALCLYETPRLQPEELISLIEAHGHGIFEEIALQLA